MLLLYLSHGTGVNGSCARPMEHNAIAGSAGLFIVEYSQWNGTNLLLGFKNKLSCGPGQIIHIKLARCSRMSVLW